MVEVNGTLSPPLPITCGVPQGSILGPLLFLVYVNDMASACDCDLFLFADDSALLVSDRNSSQVEKALSSELSKICTWLSDNKLSIHLGKTESILFGSTPKLSKVDDFIVKVGDNAITNKKEITYLGCILEANLSSEKMTTKVVKKNQPTNFIPTQDSPLGAYKHTENSSKSTHSTPLRLWCSCLVPRCLSGTKKQAPDSPKQTG